MSHLVVTALKSLLFCDSLSSLGNRQKNKKEKENVTTMWTKQNATSVELVPKTDILVSGVVP